MGTPWRGLMAPLGVSTGDGRRFLAEGFTTRTLPLGLKWQRVDTQGHDDSVMVGSCVLVNIGTSEQAVAAGWISPEGAAKANLPDGAVGAWGAGELFDDVDPQELGRLLDDVNEAKFLTEKGVIGCSVDLAAFQAVIAEVGSDEPLTEERFEELWDAAVEDGTDLPIEFLFTEAEVAAATLVGIPAFAECQPFELVVPCAEGDDDCMDELPEGMAVTAAVRSSGWSDLSLAERDTSWDGDAAAGRLAEACNLDGEEADWGCYAAGFLYQDDDADPETRGAYGFGIVDLVDDERRIVPNAVYAVASVLQGGRGGTEIPEADQDRMRTVVSGLYERMRDEFDDDSIRPPWEGDDDASSTASTVIREALTAAARTAPAELFTNPNLTAPTPLTIEPYGDFLRVYGHVATHDVCHVGIRDTCALAPASAQAYAPFHRYTRTTSGLELPVAAGRITSAFGELQRSCSCCPGHDDHACDTFSLGQAIAHHDRMTALAWVVAGEDTVNNAIWFSGIVDPSIDERGTAALGRRRLSGDWREQAGNLELVEVLALSRERPGFPLPRMRMTGGQVVSLVAAGAVRPTRSTPTIPTPPGIDLSGLAGTVADLVVDRLRTALPATLDLTTAGTAPGPVDLATAGDPPPAAELAAGLSADLDAALAGIETDDRARTVQALQAELEATG